MKIDAWRARGALGLLLGLSPSLLACSQVCYDDGVFQDPSCPMGSETDGSGTTGDTTTTETVASASGSGESGVVTEGGSQTDTLDSSTGVPQPPCPELFVILTPEPRAFELVVEQGNGMNMDLDGVSRYAAVTEVLFDMNGVVTEQQSDTRFGMLLHHRIQARPCPATPTEPPQNNASGPLAALMIANPPIGTNPVPNAVNEAVNELNQDMAPGEKTIVLVMGNEPASCAVPNPVNPLDFAATRAASVNAVDDAFNAGFPTRVVSVGGTIDTGFLQNLADAGDGGMGTYWEVTTRDELRDALFEITAVTRPCDFAIEEPVTDEQAQACTVMVNGMAATYQDPDGWDLPDPQTLLLQGAACDSIQSNAMASINLTCTCDG